MKRCAVIMAGGVGERFWPKSRKGLPKQFLCLSGDDETMIQKTVKRIENSFSHDDIFVVTNHEYKDIAAEQLPMLKPENILAEPYARNTAPCIAYAAAAVMNKYDDAVMAVLPSDHLIRYDVMFRDTLEQAAQIAEADDCLVTVGIVPTYPETGYGYIKFRPNDENSTSFAYAVDKFVEKPSLDTAKEFIASGKYLWNSGMFVWRTSVIVNKIKELLPELYDFFGEIRNGFKSDDPQAVIRQSYERVKSVSIDFGILEHADKIFTIPGSFGWDDVGSWLAMERINRTNERGNIEMGDIITVDTENSIIVGSKRIIAAVGISDLIIVDADDAVLVCDKDSTQNIKDVLKQLKENGRTELL
ncbi:MAG: sugar phosphate nucleotidyltransferase [Ruminococcus sp.]|nr:sugar phosphate nucleotidyltransferase [Ruminococcus sp.]MCM1381247.1 sugar phosphate nucleotidyltransferase [Muribaculaceae bacterium]MCM1479815.1 sugar phosphate nucleotidyltransferase [Muribaculaceae bacterium]